MNMHRWQLLFTMSVWGGCPEGLMEYSSHSGVCMEPLAIFVSSNDGTMFQLSLGPFAPAEQKIHCHERSIGLLCKSHCDNIIITKMNVESTPDDLG